MRLITDCVSELGNKFGRVRALVLTPVFELPAFEI